MEVTIFSINDVYILPNLSKLKHYMDEQQNKDFYTTISGNFLTPSYT